MYALTDFLAYFWGKLDLCNQMAMSEEMKERKRGQGRWRKKSVYLCDPTVVPWAVPVFPLCQLIMLETITSFQAGLIKDTMTFEQRRVPTQKFPNEKRSCSRNYHHHTSERDILFNSRKDFSQTFIDIKIIIQNTKLIRKWSWLILVLPKLLIFKLCS